MTQDAKNEQNVSGGSKIRAALIDDIRHCREMIEVADNIVPLIKEGRSLKEISNFYHGSDIAEAYSIARARLKNKEKIPENFIFNLEDLRFASNGAVAAYRAKRLASNTIIDAACGIGVQAIAFSRTCNKVVAIDINPRKIMYARYNAMVENANNIEFLPGDSISIATSVKKADIVFCDPERAPEEIARDTARMSPDPQKLINAYSFLTQDFCFEMPPQIKSLPFDCEREYVSLNGSLNRLNCYIGSHKESTISVAALPSGARLLHSSENCILSYASELAYLHEIDEAVVKSGLAAKIPAEAAYFLGDYLTSDVLVASPFIKASYKIISTTPNNPEAIKEGLLRIGAGSVVLHAKIDPSEYWQRRNALERGLLGTRKAHLFVIGDEALICEKVLVDQNE